MAEIKNLFTEDGRRAEHRINHEYIDEAKCHAKRTVEVWAEEKRPLKLEKKVIEKVKVSSKSLEFYKA